MGADLLRARLLTFKHELHIFAEEVRRKKTDQNQGMRWFGKCKQLLKEAQREHDKGCIETGWRLLHTAERMSYQGLKRFDQTTPQGVVNPRIEIRARMLQEQARDDLVGWRRRSVQALLAVEDDIYRSTPAPNADTPVEASSAVKGDNHRRVPDVDALSEAHRLLHESHENVHMIRRLLQRQFNQLMSMGLVSGILFLGLAFVAELRDVNLISPFAAGSSEVNSAGFVVFIILAGIFGASIFGMLSLRQQPLSTRLPQNVQSINITTARGVVGGIAALFIYFFLKTNFIMVDSSPAIYIVVGFAAGYSERMVPQAVELVAAITEKAESGKKS